MKLWFLPFVREGITPTTLTPRRQVRVSLQLSREAGGVAPRELSRNIDLLGPGDVLDLDPRQILRMTPPPDSRDAEPNFFPSIELDSPDLPWTYSPASPSGSRLMPWLVLVVIEAQAGVTIDRGEGHQSRRILRLTKDVAGRELPDLAESWAWVHAQVTCAQSTDIVNTLANSPDRTLSRLLAPRRLLPNRRYHACVVPAFRAGCVAGLARDPASDPPVVTGREPAWSQTDLPTELPVYHSWTFRTGAAGNFESLAQRLRPTPLDASIPPAEMQVALPVGPSLVVEWEGPLRLPGHASTLEPRPAAAVAHILESLGGEGDRPILGPSYFGSSWLDDRPLAPLTAWAPALNLTPMHRAAAGLGAEAVRADQEALVAAASEGLEASRLQRKESRQKQFSAAVGNRVKLRLSERSPEHIRLFSPLLAKSAGAAAPDSGMLTIAGRRLTRKSWKARPAPTSATSAAIGELLPEIAYRDAFAPAVTVLPLPLAPESTASPDGTFSPRFPRPMSEPLAERYPELMLPGLGSIPGDGVLLVESNPAFVEAYLVGANQELNHELLWRGLPADRSATAFRRFWGRADGLDDIAAISDWNDVSALGTHVHSPAAMVLLVRGELVRRYPSMLIAAVPAKWNADKKTRSPESSPVLPAFRGLIGADVLYAGFSQPSVADAIGSPKHDGPAGWFLMLSENPGDPRFGLDEGGGTEAPTVANLSWTDLHLPPDAAYATVSSLANAGFSAQAASAAGLAGLVRQRTFRVFLHASLLIRARS